MRVASECFDRGEFISRFGGGDAPVYNKMTAEIERRITALPSIADAQRAGKRNPQQLPHLGSPWQVAPST